MIQLKKSKLFYAGTALVIISFVWLVWIFYPAAYEEARYAIKSKQASSPEEQITALDKNFSIVIPKIDANARVIADVDAFKPAEYQRALTQGVAHARGTAYPGQAGNIFLFSHSGSEFYQASRFNAVFYLLNKLEAGDYVYLFYQGERIRYVVTDKKVVGADEVQYLQSRPDQRQLTMMTCWPPGTAWKRLMVIAQEK